MTLYKVLVDGNSCNGGSLTWSLPRQDGDGWIPGEWHRVSGTLSPCQNGLHLTSELGRWYKWGCAVYEAETEGPIITKSDSADVVVASACRLLRPVAHPQWWRDAVAFIESLPSLRWFQQHESPLPEWHLTLKPAWDAAWDAARHAASAQDAARDAAWVAAQHAAWVAAQGAARHAAWDAAWDAARHAASAQDAARDAAWQAARDAELYVQAKHICSGLLLDSKHVEHAEARMEVWRRGYALLCDVNGQLFVYGVGGRI